MSENKPYPNLKCPVCGGKEFFQTVGKYKLEGIGGPGLMLDGHQCKTCFHLVFFSPAVPGM